MKPGLQIGHQYEYSLEVRPEMQAQFGESVVHSLYSTAAMISNMEWAARQHILPYLEDDEEGVGYHVDVRHLKPTPIGAVVRIRSTVSGVEGNRVSSLVEAWNETDKIGEGMFVQALVPLDKLYVHGIQAPKREEEPEIPPPAELVSIDGNSRLTLEIMKWETGMFPCTRYDEWLICRAHLRTLGRSQAHEGAFLLRYEMEEWFAAVADMIASKRSAYQSDFLEPVLSVWMEASEPGEFVVTFTLTPPTENGAPEQPVTATLEVGRQALQEFCRQLDAQIEGFPSKL